MLRARRHRPRARDRPRVRARDRSIRRGFVPRIRIRTPDARANAKSTRATRARIPHTHTHTTDAPPPVRVRTTRDSRRARRRLPSPSRASTTSARVSSPRITHIGPESISLRPQPSYTTGRLPIPPIHDPHPRARTRTHPPITTPRASSTRPPARVLHRGKSKNPSAVARSIHHVARARVHRPPRLRRASSARAGG